MRLPEKFLQVIKLVIFFPTTNVCGAIMSPRRRSVVTFEDARSYGLFLAVALRMAYRR